jgi:hypothetical protein
MTNYPLTGKIEYSSDQEGGKNKKKKVGAIELVVLLFLLNN